MRDDIEALRRPHIARAALAAALGLLLLAAGCGLSEDHRAKTSREDAASSPQRLELDGGGVLLVPKDAVPEGAKVETSTVNPPELPTGLSSIAEPVDLSLDTGDQPLEPVTLSYPYDPARVPEDLTPEEVFGVSTYDEATQAWEPLEVAFDVRAKTMTATVPSFSWKWSWQIDWAAMGAQVGQSIGELVGKRADPPVCESPNRLPSWASAFTDDEPAVAVRTCAEGDPEDADVAVVQIVNNRPYGMVLSSPIDLAWSWHETPTDQAVLFASLVMDSALGKNQMYLPPLSRASIGIARGEPANAIFTAEPTWASVFLDVASQAVTAVVNGQVLKQVVGPFGSACLRPLVAKGTALDLTSIATYRDYLAESLPCLEKGVLAAVAAGELDRFKATKVSSVYKQLGRASKILLIGDAAINAADMLADQLIVAGPNTFSVLIRSEESGDAESDTSPDDVLGSVTSAQAKPFLGTWTGPVDQPGSNEYSNRTVLKLVNGKLRGSVTYPGLECSGTLARFRMSGRTLEAVETINHDPLSTCIDVVDLRFTPAGPDRLSYEALPGGSLIATAALTRVR